MAQTRDIYKKCEACEGTGIRIIEQPNPDKEHLIPVETVCPKCNGEKKYFWGTLEA